MVGKKFQFTLPSHLSDRLPHASSLISLHNSSLCKKAISHLRKQDVIGVSFEGSTIDRYTELEWLCISSPECTFLFDIKKLGRIIFEQGLKNILENKGITKVLHDCRKPSDVLLHKYDTKLCNVYDTQAAEFMVKSQKYSSGIDSKVNSLDYCLSTYLEVQEEFLYHQNNICYDDRPLSFDLRNLFMKNVMYLRSLRTKFNNILKTPFRRCTEIYLQSIQKMSDDELTLYPPNLNCIPSEMITENMEIVEVSAKLKDLMHSVKDTCQNIADPELRYQVACRKYKNVGLANESDDDDESVYFENQDNLMDRNSYFHRKEVIKFLMDKMYDNQDQQGEIRENAKFLMDRPLASKLSSSNKSIRGSSFDQLKDFLEASGKLNLSASCASSKAGDCSSNSVSPKISPATQLRALLKANKLKRSSEN